MKTELQYYLNNLINPLLFYVDKNGKSVFRNFCLFKNNGNMYNTTIQIKEAGKILEQRIELGRKFKIYCILLTIIIYFIFIHNLYTFKGFLLCELVWILMFFLGKLHCSNLYRKILMQNYGEYQVTDFNPPISEEKNKEYKKTYYERLSLLIVTIVVFIGFAFVLMGIIKFNVNKEKPSYNTAEILSVIYLKIYPQNPTIYEIRAVEDYISGDFDGATKNYLKAFDLSGRKFSDKDYTKFANLLYLIKKSSGSQNAIDKFNEYATKKKLTISQQTKLLWIKSMFSIASGLPDFVISDYNDLIASIDEKKNMKNKFYILCDKAYMFYLMRDYKDAITVYDNIIKYAKENEDEYSQDIPKLLAERGFAKKHLKDKTGANSDFVESKIDLYEVKKYEPKIIKPAFILEKF